MSLFKKEYSDLKLNDLFNAYLQDELSKKIKNRVESDFKLALSQKEFIETASKSLSEATLKQYKVASKPKKDVVCDRILNLIMSDIHYGANLDPEENLCKFSTVEEARRTAAIVSQVVDYKPQYRKNTKLYVHLIGDIIQNKLHDVLDGDPLSVQCAKAILYLTQALEYLSKNFPAGIKVFCSTGNHGRFKERHKDRAINQKWDSLESIIYYSLKNSFKNDKNIEFYIPKTPFYSVKIFDKFGYFAHGDTAIKAPFPNGNINVARISAEMDKINASRPQGHQYNLFCFGHVHTGAVLDLPNGTLVTNGALVPPDSFANSIPIWKCKTGQQLFESVHGHIVGDRRFLEVDFNTDKNVDFDRIVSPFIGF